MAESIESTKVLFKANDAIRENCCDNQWRSKDDIWEAINPPEDYTDKKLTDVIQIIKAKGAGGLCCAVKKTAKGKMFRFKKVKNKMALKVNAFYVATELEPIVEDIFKALQLKTDHDRVSHVRSNMFRLKKLVRKYSEVNDGQCEES